MILNQPRGGFENWAWEPPQKIINNSDRQKQGRALPLILHFLHRGLGAWVNVDLSICSTVCTLV